MRAIFANPVLFVAPYNDEDTVGRVQERIPGAPVLAKPVYAERLADAIAKLS